jgi:urea transport system substrate-binding protein
MSADVLEFPPFRLDVANQELWRETTRIPVRPKTFAVLLYFARNPRRLITKDELLRHVWADVIVDEELLRGYIRELRQLLGDDAESPTFLETVPRRGYRFLAEVHSPAQPAARSDESLEAVKAGGTSSGAGTAVLTIGVIHSLTGMMAWTEAAVVDATLMAVEEINERGGVRGRRVEVAIADGQSDEEVFAREADRLIRATRVSALFGCWTSASRKAVLPVVEGADHLLLYPVQYEGMEQSPHVVYTGAAPNQQIIPAIRWAFAFLGARRFHLVGWDSIYSCAVHAVVRDEIAALGGEVAGEAYLRPDGTNVLDTVREIAASTPDLIVNSTVGDLNVLYSRLLRAAGVSSQRIPTLYLSVGEIELSSLKADEVVGDYAVWNYFQSVERPENQSFLRRFRARYGPRRVTADPMEAGYIAIHLWAQAAASADTNDVRDIRSALRHQSFDAPEGWVRVDPENQHTWKTVRVGRIASGGQFDVVWSSERAIRPEPFPPSRTRAEWEALLQECYVRWGRRWSAPATAGA